MDRTPAQRAAIGEDARRFCVDAGAGSGKTLVLVERIVRLVDEGTPLDRIVAITFTDKAAAEMKARLRAAFRKRAPNDDPEAPSRWRDRERAVENARICTIHAFCAGLLREHALRLGIDPEFAPLAEHESSLLAGETVRAALLALLAGGDPAALRLCAAHRPGRVAKTLADMLRQDAALAGLAAAFPLDDAAALADQWRAAVAQDQAEHLASFRGDPGVAAFLRSLRDFADDFTGTDPDNREAIRRAQAAVLEAVRDGEPEGEIDNRLRHLDACGRNTAKKADWRDAGRCAALKALQDDVKAWIQRNLPPLDDESPGDTDACAALTRDLVAVHRAVREAHEAAKARANRLAFDDMIARALEALRASADLRARVAAGIDCLLIDEFQDTDSHQLEIAELLHAAPDGPDLFIVGDAKQSIYYFRGAEVEVFAEARGKSARVERLDANFRTLPGVLNFVNDYFARSAALHAVETRYHPMVAGRGGGAPWTPVEFLLHCAPEGARADLRAAEAGLVARRVARLLDDANGVWDAAAGAPRAAQPGDIALLFRGMGNVGLYEDALRRAGIPYALASGSGFYERQEVVDVVNALRVALDPFDEPALLGFLRSPMAALSDNAILAWTRAAGSLARAFAGPPPDNLPSPEDAAAAARARETIAALRALALGPPGPVLRRLLDETGYEAVLLSQFLGVQKAANVRKLVAQADAFQYAGARSLRAFTRYLEEVRGNAVREGEAALPGAGGAVQLLTIHKSKGLEFPVVFLVDTATPARGPDAGDLMRHRALGLVYRAPNAAGDLCDPAIAKAIKRRVRREEAAEHARLLYVALTRARDRLVISGCATGDAGERAAPAGSWLDAMDRAYGVLRKPDGGRVAGEGWSAAVVHTLPEPPPARPPRGTDAPPDAAALEARTAPLPPPPRGAVFSVSALLDAMADGLDLEEERPDPDAPRAAARPGAADAMLRGAAMHRMFETWDFAARAPRGIDDALDAVAAPAARRAAWRADLEAAAERFAASALHARMADAGTVLRETPFHLWLPECGACVAGVMDAVFDGGVIVDYKTGAPHPERQARYEWQLLLYAAAYHALRGAPPVEGVIHYVDHGHSVPVAFAPEDVAAARRHAAELIARLRAG